MYKTLSNPPNLAQTVNHHTLLPAARMPDTPVCNEIYAAGLMNPQSADRLWYTHRCSIKLAVTMFKATELECCLKSLSCHRIGVPEPSPASAPAQLIWPLTHAQMAMSSIDEQQQSKEINVSFIRKRKTFYGQMGTTALAHAWNWKNDCYKAKMPGRLHGANCTHLRNCSQWSS